MTGIILLARLGSQRLPNKALRGITGRPMVEQVILRCRKTGIPVYLAVPDNHSYFARLCQHYNLTMFIGSENDVLERMYHCAMTYHLSNVIRVTADCPMLDHTLVAKLLAKQQEDPSYEMYAVAAGEGAIEVKAKLFPDGLDAELIPIETLTKAYIESDDREHPTLWISHNCKVWMLENVKDQGKWKFSVDTEEELILMDKLFRRLGDDVSWRKAITYLRNTRL